MTWDKINEKSQRELLRNQLIGATGPHSPFWRERLASLGKSASSITDVAELTLLPAIGERDVSPIGDPADMAGLVLAATEAGFTLHAPGTTVRRALGLRIRDRNAYARIVDSEVRPTAFAWTGLGFRWPVAYTRGDLDTLARAGARCWELMGLNANDALVVLGAAAPTPLSMAIEYAALASGAPSVVTDPTVPGLRAAFALTPPSALALTADQLGLLEEFVATTESPLTALERVQTLILLGAPDAAARERARQAVPSTTTVLAMHVPSGGRMPWVECRGGGELAGFHVMPDLDVVSLVDPETAEPTPTDGEVVLTQLGVRGSAQLRWRTGDIAESIVTGVCGSCHRTLSRLTGLRAGALVVGVGDRSIDLRAVAGALAGRDDLTDWRIVVGPRSRDGAKQLVVHVAARADSEQAVISAATDIRLAAGMLPTQLVLADTQSLSSLAGTRLSKRVLSRTH